MKNRRKFLILSLGLIIVTLLYQKKIEVAVSTAKASDIDNASTQHRALGTSSVTNVSSKKTGEADSRKIISLPEPKKNLLDPEKTDLLCKLKSARINVPTQGDVQIYVARMTPFFGNDAGNVAWIKSNSCPEGTYSIIHFSDDSRVSQEIDCRNATFTEIATMSGEQGNIDEKPPKDGETNLAISGNGYFVLSCPNGRLVLTRDGRFRQGPNGGLSDKDNCTLLNQHGTSFQNFDVNHSGCNSNGECIATIDPSFDEVSGLEYINNYSFQVEDVGKLTESVSKKGAKILRPSFFVNALEDVHNLERGLTSVSWSNHPHARLNDIDCP